ncbi:MAG: PilZ domain-containing protein [Oryzomonas sp.]|jgi:hypothetical protein
MNNDIYHLVTVNDGASDGAAIIKVFSEIAAGRLKSDIMLLNYYDEVPVSYGSIIAAVDGDRIELKVHEHQALILKHDNSTLIKSRHFHHELGVHCYASYVNIAKKTAILHNFAYAQIRAERREAVRVKVRDRLPTKFSYDGVTIEGNLLDISGCGLSIQSDLVPATKSDQGGLLSFTLAGTPVTVAGSFVRATAEGSDGHVCVFKIKPDRMTDNIIGRFIYQRQVEIIQQLREGQVVE